MTETYRKTDSFLGFRLGLGCFSVPISRRGTGVADAKRRKRDPLIGLTGVADVAKRFNWDGLIQSTGPLKCHPDPSIRSSAQLKTVERKSPE
jgi:hypothetical protein